MYKMLHGRLVKRAGHRHFAVKPLKTTISERIAARSRLPAQFNKWVLPSGRGREVRP